MDGTDLAALAITATLIGGLATAIFAERTRSRRLLGAMCRETRGLCREASDLAEAICVRQAEGGTFDQDFLDRYTLSEPQTYPALAASLYRAPADLGCRAVEFHGRLSVARRRLASWRGGGQGPVSTYLLLSALVRSANAGHGLLWYGRLRLGRREEWKPHMPSANSFLDQMEDEDLELLDHGYWSL